MTNYIMEIDSQSKKRTIEDKVSRKNVHGFSDPGSTRDFKYLKAVSLAVRLSGVYIPGVEIDSGLPRFYCLQKTCIVLEPVSSSAVQ